jgi:hypothetical protein
MFSKRCLPLILLIFARLGATKYAGEPFTLGFGARALALGGSFVSISDDPSAVYWNPAGLRQVRGKGLLLMHGEYFDGLLKSDFASGSFEDLFFERSTFGVGIYILSSSGIKETELIDPDDSVYVGNVRVKGKLNYLVSSLYLSLAKEADWGVYGFTFKLHSIDLDVNRAIGIGVDFGLKKSGSVFSFGLSARDIFTTPLFWNSGTKELIYPTLITGFSIRFSDFFLISSDFNLFFEGRKKVSSYYLGPISLEPHFGGEFNFTENFSLRAGLDRGYPTFGAGLNYRFISLDYAFLSHSELGSSHRLSLTGRF